MDKSEKLEAYFQKEGPFKEGINKLRELAHKSRAEETLKWGAPVYTLENKNVFGIMSFKEHFGLWFFNGVFLSDPKKVLVSGGEAKAMRHWKFTDLNEIDESSVLAYMEEALDLQERGVVMKPETNKETVIPPVLQEALSRDIELKEKFEAFTPYKQREFCEHIDSAKHQTTKVRRLQKCIPMIREGIGLHDKYRK